jgi:DNA-binding winged helix-turn-helix (wHTH) protein
VFLEHPNRVLNRDQLLNLTQGRDADPFDRSIDIQISRLRQKLGEDARMPQIIKTVRNGGYVLAGQVTRGAAAREGFLGSMTGRVFATLLLGILLTAALTQLLADAERSA